MFSTARVKKTTETETETVRVDVIPKSSIENKIIERETNFMFLKKVFFNADFCSLEFQSRSTTRNILIPVL